MTVRMLALALAAALPPFAASAQEAFELNFGGVLASDYISDGESLSDGEPVLQGYVEAQRGLFYGGIWASTIDNGDNSLEFEFSLGVRPVFGDLEVDFSYARTLYDDTGDCCGELTLYAEYPLSETIYAGGGISYEPESGETWLEVLNGVEIDDDWSVSGSIGSDFGTSDDEDETAVSWDLGLVRQFGDTFWGDLRYHDSTIGSGSLVVSIGFDF